MTSIILLTIKDGIFAAVAGIGFSSISNPAPKVYPCCAALAAVGHMTRYLLMNVCGFELVYGSLIAAIVIGVMSLPMAKLIRTPAECISYPALLPMVPGMYAYRTVQALVQSVSISSEPEFMHYLYLLEQNWMVCMATIIGMVVGVTLPILIFGKFSFKVTMR